jgi:hypothetical protein
MTQTTWHDDSLQFPRLIAEIYAGGGLTDEMYDFLEDSMDLQDGELDELFERALKRWDQIKAATDHTGYHPERDEGVKMKTYLMPIEERTELDAIRVAAERTEEQGRKFVVRKAEGKFFVVPLYEAGREGDRHDAGYACLGVLVEESL